MQVTVTFDAIARRVVGIIRARSHASERAAVLGTKRNCPTQDNFRARRSRIATYPLCSKRSRTNFDRRHEIIIELSRGKYGHRVISDTVIVTCSTHLGFSTPRFLVCRCHI